MANLININGIDEIDLTLPGSTTVSTSDGVTTITNTLPVGSTTKSIGITIDGGGSSPSTGVKGFVDIPFNCTITGWTIVADQSGSASLDVWFIAGSGAPPTAPNVPNSGNKISASAPITLTTAQAASGGSAAITTWTTALTQWGTLAFNLSSVTTCQRITVQIQVTLT